jgi:two-component system sporulation sensor kinase A
MHSNEKDKLNEFLCGQTSVAEAFDCLLENASDAIYILDLQGNFVAVNRKAEELTGFNRKDFVGKSFRKLIPARSLPKAIKGFLNVIRGKEIRLELEIKTVSNKKLLAELTSRPFISGGEIVGTVGIVRDIGERVKMEKRLKETNERLEALLRTAMEGITLADPDDKLTFVNKAFADMLGYEESKLLGLNLRKLVDEDDFRRIRKETEQRKKGVTSRYELDMCRKDGQVCTVQVSASPLWDEEGRFVATLAIVMNVTERKRAEKALEESEKRYRTLFESASDGFVYLDTSGRIRDLNERALSVFGGSKEEILGKHFSKLGVISFKDLPMLLKAFARIVGGKEGRSNIRIMNKKGQEHYLDTSSSIIRSNDRIAGILIIARDVTEKMQMHKKLEEYSQHLEELVEHRTRELKEAEEQLIKSERLATIGQVAAMVGHDLRNPLTGINSAAYYLKTRLGKQADVKTREMLELIEKDVQYANKIIGDLVEYSREMKLDITESTPKPIVKDALRLVEIPSCVQVLDLTEDKPKVEMDVDKIRRVLANLIRNAVEAMPEGGKLTTMSRQSDGKVEIVVRDSGTGMPQQIIGKIWTPFFTTKAKGMGLGLPICKRIVEAHGGQLSVRSIVGKGSVFTLTLPLKLSLDGGEKVWATARESLLLMTTRASEKS